jgi:hypothetical protein
MKMPSLGDTSTLLRTVRQPVSLDERDLLVKLRQHSSSEHPGHTRTAHNGSLSEIAHRHSPHRHPMTLPVKTAATVVITIRSCRRFRESETVQKNHDDGQANGNRCAR